MSLRLAHLSDPHLWVPDCAWRWQDWLGKRIFTWANLRVFGRWKRFALADRVLERLSAELTTRNFDRVIFSGDATALGFETEHRRAAELLQVERLRGLATPGNHDYCTRHAAASGAFERCFASWQKGERLDGCTYPFAQRVGDAWLIGVNSAKANRGFWNASGQTGREQLDRLRRLLQQLSHGPRILVTHYPICLADGRHETFAHGLNDLRETVEIAAVGGVGLWLHGHRHRFYWLQQPSFAPFPVICAGSATQTGLWSYGEYVIDGNRLGGTRREYDPARDTFRDAETFELALIG
jgi:3',5'-cyclic AMP phosphodiesterase CpdA